MKERANLKRILLSFLAITLICLCIAGCGGQSPLDTVEEFMINFAEQDYARAYSMLSTSSQQKISFEEFSGDSKDGVSSLSGEELEEQREELSKVKYELDEESEDEALVYLTHADYPLSYFTIALVKEGNVWKIDFFNSTLLRAAKESAEEKTCKANMMFIMSSSKIYAAASDEGVYPTSWDDLVPYYIHEEEHSPSCPIDGTPYNIKWSEEAPPEIECPNHGSI